MRDIEARTVKRVQACIANKSATDGVVEAGYRIVERESTDDHDDIIEAAVESGLLQRMHLEDAALYDLEREVLR